MGEQNIKNLVIGPELERIVEGSLGELLLLVLTNHEENILQVISNIHFYYECLKLILTG